MYAALSGAVMVAGSLNSIGKIVHLLTKSSTYKLISKINHDFEEKVGALTCIIIKGVDSGAELLSCDGCVEDAVNILEKHCFTNKE